MSVLVWIAGVDIPWALIEAQREGRLVLFVGAGASRSSPSDLPDFRQLAARIAADSGVTVTDEQYERLRQTDTDLNRLIHSLIDSVH